MEAPGRMSAVPAIWAYRARPVRVIDGDTIEVTVDAGFANYRTERLRLLVLRPTATLAEQRYSLADGCHAVALPSCCASAIPF